MIKMEILFRNTRYVLTQSELTRLMPVLEALPEIAPVTVTLREDLLKALYPGTDAPVVPDPLPDETADPLGVLLRDRDPLKPADHDSMKKGASR